MQALQDAQRAVSWVRAQCGELGIDPQKIGVIGFSAGGHMVAAVSTRFSRRAYPRQDTIDDYSCRPNFAAAIYPGHLCNHVGTLNPNITVTKDTPPTFLAHAKDDPIDDPRNSMTYYHALRRATVPVELHLFPRGGHAFGLRKDALPVGEWPKLMHRWLQRLKFL